MQLWKHLPRTRPMHACPRCSSDLTSQTVISHLWPLSVTRSKRSKTKELLNMKSAESCCLAAAELALQPNPRGCDEVWIHTFTTSQLNLQRPVPPAPTWTVTLWFYECLHHTLKDENVSAPIRKAASGRKVSYDVFVVRVPPALDEALAFLQFCFYLKARARKTVTLSPLQLFISSVPARLSAQCLKLLAAATAPLSLLVDTIKISISKSYTALYSSHSQGFQKSWPMTLRSRSLRSELIWCF